MLSGFLKANTQKSDDLWNLPINEKKIMYEEMRENFTETQDISRSLFQKNWTWEKQPNSAHLSLVRRNKPQKVFYMISHRAT